MFPPGSDPEVCIGYYLVGITGVGKGQWAAKLNRGGGRSAAGQLPNEPCERYRRSNIINQRLDIAEDKDVVLGRDQQRSPVKRWRGMDRITRHCRQNRAPA